MSGIVTQNVLGTSGLVKAVSAGGTWVEIKSLTTDGSDETLSFVNGASDVVFDSTYPVYCFRWFNMHPATDNTPISFNFSDDTSSHSYDITKTTSYYENQRDESGGDGGGSGVLQYNAGNDLAQGTGFQVMSYQDATGADDNAGGYLYVFAPSNTTYTKSFFARQQHNANYVICQGTFISGYANTTAALTAVQFKYDSGDMDAGTIKMFGIKDS